MDDQQATVRSVVEEMIRFAHTDATNLARRAKVAPSTLTRFLNGEVKHSLSLRTLMKLSNASGMRLPRSLAMEGEDQPSMVAVVGYVGAGAEVYPTDEGELGTGLEYVPMPPGADDPLVAVVVRGTSMKPVFWDGDMLYYTRDSGFDRDECLYRECVVKLVDGRTYVKYVMPGRTASVFTLQSYNAAPILDVEIEWAAPIQYQDRRRRRPQAEVRDLVRPKAKRRRKA